MGGGRASATDTIDTTVGIEVHFKMGAPTKVGDTLFTLYCDDNNKINTAKEALRMGFEVQPKQPKTNPLIFEMVRGEDVK